MTLLDPVRLREHLHGHVGWLAAIALVHPAIVLGRTRRKAHWAVGLGTAMVSLTACLGATLYDDYRDRLRQSIFQHAPMIGFLFERKEHLAFGAVGLTWAGCLSYLAALRLEGDARDRLRRAAQWAFIAAATLAVATAGLGTVIATYKTF